MGGNSIGLVKWVLLLQDFSEPSACCESPSENHRNLFLGGSFHGNSLQWKTLVQKN